jgi:hypothetical protein
VIALRRSRPDLTGGDYVSLPAPAGVWSWRRGKGTAVALNLSDNVATVEVGPGSVLIGTVRARAGDAVLGRLRLDPWEGCVVASAPI